MASRFVRIFACKRITMFVNGVFRMTRRTRPIIIMKRPKRWETFWRGSYSPLIYSNRRFWPPFSLRWIIIPSTTIVCCIDLIVSSLPMTLKYFNYLLMLAVINTWLDTLLDFIEFLPVDCLQREVTHWNFIF